MMLKRFKQATLRSLKSSGMSSLVRDSRWRRERLLILAYHGVSLNDEHLWNGSQYISAKLLRNRLDLLRNLRCAVLPLGEAVERLYAKDLPPNSVAITFDDGSSDFFRQAHPLLKEYDCPATVYLTTFYTNYNRPVFDLMCSYLMWKGRSRTLDLKQFTQRDIRISLRELDSREFATREIRACAWERKMTAEEKDKLLTSLAAHLKVDYETLLEQRVLHNLTPGEVSQLAADGADIQLHTHRHRTPLDPGLFMREIEDNRESIRSMTGKSASHFCYPSGVYEPAFLPWLRDAGVVSATTCEPGFASPTSNRLLLPRILDNESLSPIEFESWLTGISAALPQRRVEKARA